MAYTAGLAMTAYQPQKYTNGHITQINVTFKEKKRLAV